MKKFPKLIFSVSVLGLFTVTAVFATPKNGAQTPVPYQAMSFPSGVVPLPAEVLQARSRQGFNVGTLTNLIDHNPSIQSIDTLVPALPLSYRRAMALIYKTQSIQGASFEFPRVIAYGEYGEVLPDDLQTLTLAYKGAPDVASPSGAIDDDVEMVDFNTDTQKFELYALRFEPNGDKNYKVLGPNPPICMTCHQGMPSPYDPRPNWARYPHWDGVYGSSDNPPADEQPGWNTFYAKHFKTSPRYASLKLDPEEYKQENGRPGVLSNQRFDQKLNILDAKRVSRLIQSSPDYQKYRFAIYAGLRNCPNLPSFLPASYPQHSGGLDYAHLLADTQAKQATCCSGGSEIPLYQATKVTNLRYLFENRDLSIDSWFTNFPVNNYHMSFEIIPYDSVEPWVAAFETDISSQNKDRELLQFMPLDKDGSDSTQDYTSVNCAGLRQKSLDALK